MLVVKGDLAFLHLDAHIRDLGEDARLQRLVERRRVRVLLQFEKLQDVHIHKISSLPAHDLRRIFSIGLPLASSSTSLSR